METRYRFFLSLRLVEKVAGLFENLNAILKLLFLLFKPDHPKVKETTYGVVQIITENRCLKIHAIVFGGFSCPGRGCGLMIAAKILFFSDNRSQTWQPKFGEARCLRLKKSLPLPVRQNKC